ncbi:MAG: hypothetical protein JOZ32_16100 [Bryobacterales bacterium]|nr:hypothetical protein [Bryobacterales bacterium]
MNLVTRIAILCAVLICLAGVFWTINGRQRSQSTSSYLHSAEQARPGQIANVTIVGKTVNVEIWDSSFEPGRLLLNAAPFVLLVGFWFVLLLFKFPNGPRRLAG